MDWIQPEHMGMRVKHMSGATGTLIHDEEDEWPAEPLVDVLWDDGVKDVCPEDELVFI